MCVCKIIFVVRGYYWLVVDCVCVRVCRQVDLNSKNVFGQPRLRASLRDLRSPRRPAQKSTIEDDLKKLIIMDTPADTPQETVSVHTQARTREKVWCGIASLIMLCHL